MSNHTVQQGECLSRIAVNYGFRDFRTVYDDPGNEDLRKIRPDPNLLFPGDVVFIPEKEPKEESGATAQLHTFRLSAQRRVLRLVLEGLDGEKMASEPYELDIEGDVVSGVTGPDGLIERAIPLDAVNGTLTTTRYSWPLNVAHLNPLDDTNDDGITGIQARLRNLGFDPGEIDGIAGPRTKDAIIAFQEDNPPLKVDGICGPKTRALLVELYGC
jgi:N-acetylmuramoyl-L-alanine amidase